MSKKPKNSDLEKYGISINFNTVKRTVTQKDLEKDLVKEVGKNINVKIDSNGNYN